ncbi:2OG-Fe dioxygenase family protein [Yersinia intermedia]|uniref:2OG-Fe dioxygenase family protein n=1 Tax=Yersinia intermedia TaxID=631 RepID=UPI001CFE8CF7|nr:2OG-Fe dioxygenase family protein [Yersinia intermedia]MCB5315493.1 2OG-Fe dioxygenase family protein [Yersinia intermedia]MCB5329566.1 2OG-Fe dioxygenase family protein [Yersinia intermedia]
MGIKYKIIHFNINDLGVDINSVKNALSFKSLAWDTNDIKISQLKFLARKFHNDKPVIFQEAQRYLDDRTPPPNIKKLILLLSEEDRQTFYAYKPFRKRSISRFIVKSINNQWEVSNVESPELTNFTQHPDSPSDLRKLKRRFPPMDLATSHSFILKKLIIRFVEMLCECEHERKIKKVEVTCHQMSLIIDNTMNSACNSPEGLHQDGSDYIVSALVIDKYNIDGGTSKLYCTEREEFIKSHTLNCGEGLFHIDRNSTIWHKVTPIKLKEPSIKIGYRNILGFDFNYIQ